MPRRKPVVPLRIDIRDQRLRGGRIVLSSRTTNRVEARRRENAVRWLLQRAELEIVERLRTRADPLRIEAVVSALDDHDIDRLRRGASDALTAGALVERSMQTIRATLEPGTIKEYACATDAWLRVVGKDRDAVTYSTQDAEDYLHAPKAKRRRGETILEPWSPGQQEKISILLGRVWNDAIEREAEQAEMVSARPRLTRNPWKAAEVKGQTVKRVAFLQAVEWRRIVDTNRGYARLAHVACCCLAGLRQMESAHLRLGIDVDMERRVLRIQPREGAYPWKPKRSKKGNARSVRDVPICDELHRILTAHIEAGFAGDLYLFRLPGEDRPLSAPTLQKWTRQAFAAAKIPYGREGDDLTTHGLRHTFASWLVQRDTQMLKVGRLMGDTVLEIERTYGHLLPGDLAQAVRVIDEAVRP